MKDRPPSFRRVLRPDELRLWKAVTRTVRASRPQPEAAASEQRAADAADSTARAAPQTGPPPATKAEPPAPLRLAPMEPRLRRRLARGRADIDAILDLHGATEADAHRRVVDFILRRHAEGARTILIVTGKGRVDGFGGGGVLWRNAPLWLQATSLRRFVLSVERADRAHGGEGALYVRLRRRRPDGS
jgi:DNA-nicking Smr family endonuclease